MALATATRAALVSALANTKAADEVADILEAAQALSGTEAGFIDGVTAGTALASKAVVLGASKEIATITTATITNLNSTTIVAAGAVTSASPTTGIGYATGAGGAQTQATDKSTTVVSNTITTAITMNNAALNAGVIVGFTFTNSAIAATDTVLVTHQSAGTSGAYVCNAFPGAGSAVISVRNTTAGNLSEAIVLRVTVIKSVSA